MAVLGGRHLGFIASPMGALRWSESPALGPENETLALNADADPSLPVQNSKYKSAGTQEHAHAQTQVSIPTRAQIDTDRVRLLTLDHRGL